MISSIRHVGFVVSNLEESLKFYSGILNLEIYRRFTEHGEFIDSLTGIKGVTLEWVKLIIPSGGLIELLQYHSHPEPSDSRDTAFPSNRLGCSHLALTVEDLSLIYDRLTEAGYICKSAPLIAPGGKAKILYCHDPDGAILELIEDL
jgi:catechol 2,3-dioxygenase-like lactoylglutathione lyase family enzyme